MTDLSSTSARSHLKRRNRHQMMIKGFGMAAIGFAALMLFILVSSLVSSG